MIDIDEASRQIDEWTRKLMVAIEMIPDVRDRAEGMRLLVEVTSGEIKPEESHALADLLKKWKVEEWAR